MGTEDVPLADTETLHNSITFLSAENLIGINGGCENGGVLIVLTLLGGHSLDINVNIACECYLVCVVDKNDLSGEMSTCALVNLEIKLSEGQEADLTEKLRALWQDPSLAVMADYCRRPLFDTQEEYAYKLIHIYRGE